MRSLAACMLLFWLSTATHALQGLVLDGELDDAAILALDKPEQPELPDAFAAEEQMAELRVKFEGKNLKTDVAATEALQKYVELFNVFRYSRPPIDLGYNVSTDEDDYDATSSTTAARKVKKFIKARSDGQFVWRRGSKRKRFKFVGTNLYNLGIKGIYSKRQVVQALQETAFRGITVIRIWCYGNGYGDYEPWQRPYPFQPTPGEYSEEAFQHLDFVLQEAAVVGIRVVCVLANSLPDFGGIDWYVNKLARGGSKHKFYEEPYCKWYYKMYVEYLLNRKNSITKIQYKHDPAIFAFELINEPVLEGGYDASKQRKPGTTLRDWVCEMSTFMKWVGAKQMIAVGDEGYRADGRTNVPHFNWINGGSKGVDFVGNLKCQHISYGTIHWYPETYAIPAQNATTFTRDYLADRAEIARTLGKPIVLEEYGMTKGYMPKRNKLLNSITRTAFYHGYAGTMVWQVHPDHLKPAGNPMEFGHSGDGGRSIRSQVKYVKAQNKGKRPPPTPLPRTPPCIDLGKDCMTQTAHATKCYNWVSGYCRQTCNMCGHWQGWDSSIPGPGGRKPSIIQ